MEKKKKTNIVIRVLTAVCFSWVLITGVSNFITARAYESGDIVAIVVALLPAIAGLVIIIGALTGARIVFGLGAVIYLLQAGYSIYVYIMQLPQDLPDEAKAGFRSLIITTALMAAAFLLLALACFIRRSDLALCILAIVLFVVYFFVRRAGLAAEASQIPLILISAGSVLGTILLGMSFAVGKRKKEA